MATAISGTTGVNKVTYDAIKTGMGVTGSAPIYACRAWVNFNGTGTVAIRASGNVSSITDNGTGNYTVNFTTAMVDTNYCVNATTQRTGTTSASSAAVRASDLSTYTTSNVQILCNGTDTTAIDMNSVFVSVFR